MGNSIISVIIPVYNVETCISQCLDSVLGQTYRELQVILVDDGSTDLSGSICDRYAEQDRRIQVIHKENEGLGKARNAGLLSAEGEYVSFLDSDDYLDKGAYLSLLQYIEKTEKGADICFYGHYWVQNGVAAAYDVPPQKLIYRREEALKELFLPNMTGKPKGGRCFTGISAWAALYRREFLKEKQLSFYSEREILNEDIVFNFDACALADAVIVYPHYLYYYVKRGDSLTGSYRADRFDAAVRMSSLLEEKAAVLNRRQDCRQGIAQVFVMNLIISLKQETYFEPVLGHKTVLRNIERICRSTHTKAIQKSAVGRENGILQRILLSGIEAGRIKMVYLLLKGKIETEKRKRK